jgi:hypothetical protein
LPGSEDWRVVEAGNFAMQACGSRILHLGHRPVDQLPRLTSPHAHTLDDAALERVASPEHATTKP